MNLFFLDDEVDALNRNRARAASGQRAAANPRIAAPRRHIRDGRELFRLQCGLEGENSRLYLPVKLARPAHGGRFAKEAE